MKPDVPTVRTVATMASVAGTISLLVVGAIHGPASALKKSDSSLVDVTVPLKGAILEGNRNSKAAIVVFSDFQCPFCGHIARNVLPHLRSTLVQSGEALLAFRQFPLTSLHPLSWSAAAASLCAAEQTRFWPMHDLLFADQKHLSLADLRRAAARLSLDLARFDTCVDSPKTNARVQEDVDLAFYLGLASTPTILVGKLDDSDNFTVLAKFGGSATTEAIAATVRAMAAPR